MRFSSLFPNVRLVGVLLTEGLKYALILPLLRQGKETNKALSSADLLVHLVNGHQYEASGRINFENVQFQVLVIARPAPRSDAERVNTLPVDDPAVKAYLAGTYVTPMTFSGVGGTLYDLGVIKRFDLITHRYRR